MVNYQIISVYNRWYFTSELCLGLKFSHDLTALHCLRHNFRKADAFNVWREFVETSVHFHECFVADRRSRPSSLWIILNAFLREVYPLTFIENSSISRCATLECLISLTVQFSLLFSFVCCLHWFGTLLPLVLIFGRCSLDVCQVFNTYIFEFSFNFSGPVDHLYYCLY